MHHVISTIVRTALDRGGDRNAIAFQDRWQSWRWVVDYGQKALALTGASQRIGIVARNQPPHVAILAVGIAHELSTTMIHAAQSPLSLARQIRELRLDAVFASRDDWTSETLDAAQDCGTAAVSLEDTPLLLTPSGQNFRRPNIEPDADVAVTLLSSGTTGTPKHIPLSWSALDRMVAGTTAIYAGASQTVAPIVFAHPLGNIAGLAYILPAITQNQPIVLLEKFEALDWARSVRTYRPYRAAIPPVGIRMLLDQQITPEDLQSLALVAVGGGKLDPALHDAFEQRFGIPLLTAYGATEFGGVVASWSLDDYRKNGARKRGSAGKASGGAMLRVVDQDSKTPLGANQSGLLEVCTPRIGPDWITTTDIASVDSDGYLFIHGRADGAINRGGFKIVPEQVAAVLTQHPAVADAAVIGLKDERLGEVPVAAIELLEGGSTSEEDLRKWAKDHLMAYQVPVAVKIVEALPRNDSMKVSLDRVLALFTSG
jgi:acyl-coenzyme A synthetase/AMP-(fatty) acid ligase